MKTRVKWLDNMSFVGESGSGHSVVMDGPPDSGGRNLGVRPMEMLLLGLGGCASFDIVSMLKKGKQDLIDCEVEITAERADSQPKVFTKIHLQFIISGNDLSEKRVARAIELSADKYCSASIMLGEIAEITHDYELN
jgi:putative redox protein